MKIHKLSRMIRKKVIMIAINGEIKKENGERNILDLYKATHLNQREKIKRKHLPD